jgi:hypothetical protein
MDNVVESIQVVKGPGVSDVNSEWPAAWPARPERSPRRTVPLRPGSGRARRVVGTPRTVTGENTATDPHP